MIKRILMAALLALSFSQAHAQIVGPLPYTLTNGQPADATQVMADFNKIVNDVNTNVIFPAFTQQSYYAAAGGTANALTAAVSPAPSIYAPGMVVDVKITTTNTGSATINVNALGVQNIVNPNGASLRSQQMLAGQVATLVYDGSQFQLQSLSPLGVRQLAVSRTTAVYTTPGAWTFTVPVGVYSVRVEAWGAGGQGGAAVGGLAGGGGGAGAYGLTYLSVTPGDTISGVVGAGGTTGTSLTAGQAGGSTTILLNGVLQGTVGGGSGGGYGGGTTGGAYTNGGNASGSWSFSSSGQNGSSAGAGYVNAFVVTGGIGGISPRGGVGGLGSPYAGSPVAGTPGGTPGGGGGGAAGAIAGGAGANGWVYIEY